MALPKMDLPVGKERKGPAPDMDSIHRWNFLKLDSLIYHCNSSIAQSTVQQEVCPGKEANIHNHNAEKV